MAEFCYLENRHDVIFSAEVEFQYGGSLGEFNGMSFQSHLPHCRVLPPGEFNVMIPELRVTSQGAATG